MDAYELALQSAFDRKARWLSTDDLLLGLVSAGGLASEILLALGFRFEAVDRSASGAPTTRIEEPTARESATHTRRLKSPCLG
jgi:hypothetical protein